MFSQGFCNRLAGAPRASVSVAEATGLAAWFPERVNMVKRKPSGLSVSSSEEPTDMPKGGFYARSQGVGRSGHDIVDNIGTGVASSER